MSALAGISPEVLALLGGGAGLDFAGQLAGGQSDARAARKARDWTDRRTAQYAANLGRFTFGGDFDQFYRDGFGIYDNPNGSGAGSRGFIDSFGGPVLKQMQDLENAVSARQTGNLGYFDQDTARLEGADAAGDSDLMGFYGQTERGVGDLYDQMEQALRQIGAGREKQIRTDAGDRLRGLDAQTTALMAARGFGNSTSAVQALGGNALNVGRETDRSLNDLNDQLMGNVAAARGAKAGALERVRSGAGAVKASRTAGRSASRYSRAGQRMALEDSNLGKDITLRRDRLGTIMQTLSSPTLTPWASRSAPVGTNNGLSEGLQGLGGSIGAFASSAAGSQMQQALLEQMLKQYGVGGNDGWR